MIRYLKRIFGFVLLFTALCIALLFYYKNMLNKHMLTHNNSTNRVVILGDSHFQNGIVDSAFAKEPVNLSLSGETYFNAYQKLQYLYIHGYTFDKILISLGPHNLDSKIDSLWVKNQENFISTFGDFGVIFNLKQVIDYFEITDFGLYTALGCFVESVAQSVYTIERQILLGKFVYIGGFVPNTKVFADTKSGDIRVNDVDIQISDVQRSYLNQIVLLAKTYGDTVFLINAPLYSGARLPSKIPFFSSSNVRIFDYGDLYLHRADLFADRVHLNPMGASLFSRKLKDDLDL